ncbi:hypothetical protein LOTGIDRAFT_156603 [Lottia gigantea]|uniref:Tubulin-specific chaperone D n=1 Tax=Lottia gigantea TaxID=225164 RepID=V4CNM1_LOTGI|nr:hypothetical protein LOTGIDRAFT_156603 [Lottia gigantea]ESP04000.1 hypothetical protein LOTGIDRAFT_156603 [Lottia gigantea]
MAVDKVSTNSDKNDDSEKVDCFLEEFKEIEEVRNIISKLPETYREQTSREISIERFTYIVDLYQEQPHLIDSHLEFLLLELLKITRDVSSPTDLINEAFKYVYLITKMRGYKVVLRLFPHEVVDVEPVMALLIKQNPTDFTCWETRYVLLLWMSMLCKIPFDLTRLDVKGQAGQKEPIMDRIYQIGQSYLYVIDKCRDAAAFMLSHFLSRPDVSKVKLSPFLDWAMKTIKEADCETMIGINITCGILSSIALLYKHGKREDMLQYAPDVLEGISECNLKEKPNSILRKTAIKVIQRLGLTFLKSQVISWRYNRGNRSLTNNLQSTSSNTTSITNSQTIPADQEDEEDEVPEHVEEILGELLEGLKDRDTIVRWSAAKGIGRVTGRLTRTLADEVVETALQLFTLQETDGAWHGGCLALAELGRRGLLLPDRLSTVVPVVLKALAYDERKGNFSVGSHVRDAACYICWSFARAYEPEELKPYVNQIANGLILATIFDREVNVRRAASAAFQENVGRQGIFPHGIDILTTADYFAVGNRSHCFLEISVYVAQFPEYTHHLVDHLINIKISHWDSHTPPGKCSCAQLHKLGGVLVAGAIRELSSEALHNLTEKCPEYMIETALPSILDKITTIDLYMRHGAVLSAAQVTYSLYKHATKDNKKLEDIVDVTSRDRLMNIAGQLQKANLFKGLGADLMRKAVCCLIKMLSLSKLPYHGLPVIDLWQDIIDDCLLHIDPEIQGCAVLALPCMIEEYYTNVKTPQSEQTQDEVLKRYINHLKSSVQTTRSGFSLALGAIPKSMLKNHLKPVLDSLISSSKINTGEEVMAESRRDALKAITSICNTVGIYTEGDSNSVINKHNLPAIYKAYLIAMLDYTLDSRGDVGAWVREASMSGLLEVSTLVVNSSPDLLTADICKMMFQCLIQQCCEKIDRTRAHAGYIFYRLLHLKPNIPNIPHREFLLKLFPSTCVENINWAAPSDTFPLFVKLLELPTFTYNVLLGTCVSVGGLTESLVQNSSQSLFNYLRQIEKDQNKLAHFCDVLVQIYKDFVKVERVTTPLLKMTDQILSNGCIESYLSLPDCKIPVLLCECVKNEKFKSGDLNKLMASADVFCGLLQFEGEVREKALFQLMLFLCFKYPRVRKTTANKLYEALLTYDFVDEDVSEEVQSILCDTNWDLPVPEILPTRNKLCDLIGVKKPVLKTAQKSNKD